MKFYVCEITGTNASDPVEDVKRSLTEMQEDAEWRFAWNDDAEAVEYAIEDPDADLFTMVRIHRDGAIEEEVSFSDGRTSIRRIA